MDGACGSHALGGDGLGHWDGWGFIMPGWHAGLAGVAGR